MSGIRHKGVLGDSLSETIKDMVKIADNTGQEVTNNDFEVTIVVKPGDDPVEVAVKWGITLAGKIGRQKDTGR